MGAGTLRFAYASEPPTLDPLAPGGASSETRDILRPLLPALFRLNAKLRPEPDLVRAWPSHSDFTLDPFSVKLTLKQAAWSDGQPITSSDVAFSLTNLRGGPTGYRYRFLKSVQVLTPRSFTLHFDRPLRRWWSLFSLDDMVLPAHAYSAKWASGPSVSGGPFIFNGWTKGFDVKLARNPTYYGDKASLQTLDIQFVPDDQNRLELLRQKKIDAFFSEGEPNMGRRATAYGFPATDKAIDGSAAASGVWGPTYIELELSDAKLSAPLRRGIIEGTGPALAAEIFEDSARRLDAIPPSFRTEPEVRPWKGRGDLQRAAALSAGTTRSFQLGFALGPSGAIANFLHFRLAPQFSVELAGVEPAAFEKTWVPTHKSSAFLRVRRGADAPDADAYGGAYVAVAESTGGGTDIETGLDPATWSKAEIALQQTATVAPIVQLRSWIVAGDGVFGPQPTGTLEGPFVDAAHWRVENHS